MPSYSSVFGTRANGRSWSAGTVPAGLRRTASIPRKRLHDFGADLHHTPFSPARELVGFQRWIIDAHNERQAGWF